MRKALLLLAVVLSAPLLRAEAPPETIVSIAHPKRGKEADLLAALRETHAVYGKLQAVTGGYTLYRGSDEAGGVTYIEIFTWRSGDIPDNAPPEIRAVWAKLQSLVESRNGRAGIEFYAVEPLSERSSLPAAGPSR